MNNTLRNGFKVLEILANEAEAHSVKEIAERLGLPNSHACRLLKTLKEAGYVVQEPGNREYRIGLKILCLGNSCLSRMEIRRMARPFMDRLANETGWTVYLSLPLNFEAVIVDVVYPNGIASDPAVTIGCINPLNSSASGKLCAAFGDQKELKRHLKSYKFVKSTARTIVKAEVLMNELESVRTEKIAVSDSERGNDIFAVAAPVFNFRGEFTAAVGISCSGKEMTDSEKEVIKMRITECAESASFAIGYASERLK